MNKILFDLKECDLSINDFNALINRNLDSNISVNGYRIIWSYDVVNGIVELTVLLERI